MKNCIVCWENNVETSQRILTTSKEWQENSMQIVIEKHFNWWHLRESPNKDKVPWICRSCWLEISSFHSFYVRVENVHKQFPSTSVVLVPKNIISKLKRRRGSSRTDSRGNVEELCTENVHEEFPSTSDHKSPEAVVVPKRIIPKLKRGRGKPRKDSSGNVEELCIENVHKQFPSTSDHKSPETIVVPKKIIPNLKRRRDRPRKDSSDNVEELCSTVNNKSEVRDFFEMSPLNPNPAKELHNVTGECSDFISPDPLLKQTKAIEKNNNEEYDDSLEEANSNIIEELNIADIKHEKVSEAIQFDLEIANSNIIEKLNIADIKHEKVSEAIQFDLKIEPMLHQLDYCDDDSSDKGSEHEQVSDEIQFDMQMEPMRHLLDHCDDDYDKGSDPECTAANDSAVDYYGIEFHKDIKSYLDYQQKRKGVKDLNIINDEFIAANHKLFCDLCKERFEDFKTLLTHFKTEHNVPGYVKCCGKKLSKQSHLVDHIHFHKNPQFFKCPDCEKCFNTRYYFLIHVGNHKKGPARIFACDICDVKLVSKALLKNHKRRKHDEENLKEHICPICSRVSASLMIHKDHIKVAHRTERKHKCHICPKAFKYPKLLREHMGKHTKEALYSCPFCPMTFIRNGEFYKHKKHEHPKKWQEERQKRLSNKEDNIGKKKILKLI